MYIARYLQNLFYPLAIEVENSMIRGWQQTLDFYVMPQLKYQINLLAGFYATCMNCYVEILKIKD